jgi:protocatechuate 3,4-dioxygenase beta subunit
MQPSTRRQFLVTGVASAMAAAWTRVSGAAQRGLDQFMVPAPPCKEEDLTPAVPAGPDYKANAPARTSLLEPGMTGRKIAVSGYVIGLTCGRVKGARVEFWQADAAGAYDSRGFRLRGHQMTDADGRYTLETIVPGATVGGARHINARIVPPGKPALTTRMYFPDEAANAKDPAFSPKLSMKRAPGSAEAYTFDFVLNI